jgi:hypothetical protein
LRPLRTAFAIVLLLGSSLSIRTADAGGIDTSGGGGQSAEGGADNGRPVVVVHDGGEGPGKSGRKPSGGVQCFYIDAPAGTSGGIPQSPAVGGTVGSLVEGQLYWVYCYGLDNSFLYWRLFVYQPGVPAISGAQLAVMARAELDLVLPAPKANPPVGAEQLVGIKTWLWIDPTIWRPLTATASVPGISATVTATPYATEWRMGDGRTVACDGPGTPYEPGASTDCGHVYSVDSSGQADGVYAATVTMFWRVTWSATDGTGGDLGTLARTTPFELLVGQRQAVVR